VINIYSSVNSIPRNMGYSFSNPYYQRVYPTRHNNNINNSIRVTGKGEVTVKPNQASLLVGVVVDDMKVQNAQQQNAIISNQIIEALKNIGINQEDIETSSYSIDRLVDYQDSQEIFRGYRVSHILKVTVKDIASVGKVIDVATENGANVVRNVSFEVSDPEPYYLEALKQATLNAKSKAESIAKSLGLTINSVPEWIVEESVQLLRPQYSMQTAVLSASTTIIQEGQIKISASVQALFNYISF